MIKGEVFGHLPYEHIERLALERSLKNYKTGKNRVLATSHECCLLQSEGHLAYVKYGRNVEEC